MDSWGIEKGVICLLAGCEGDLGGGKFEKEEDHLC